MSELVADCPRCGARKITFDLKRSHCFVVHYNWQKNFEAFCVCRHCNRATIFILQQLSSSHSLDENGLEATRDAVNRYMNVERFISLKDVVAVSPPEHLPVEIVAAFNEGATCMSAGCYNAAGTMFRLCVDLATRSKLPEQDVPGLNATVRRNLGLRLRWLFDNGHLPEALRELSSCIREDGNDGAHVGSLEKSAAEDLLDFTVALLERMYTEPERIQRAKNRRDTRRSKTTGT